MYVTNEVTGGERIDNGHKKRICDDSHLKAMQQGDTHCEAMDCAVGNFKHKQVISLSPEAMPNKLYPHTLPHDTLNAHSSFFIKLFLHHC